MTARLVVLVSGAGTNLQALIDACADQSYGAVVAAVGADRSGIEGLARAEHVGIPTFVRRVADYPARAAWDRALADCCAAFDPDLVVSAGEGGRAGVARRHRGRDGPRRMVCPRPEGEGRALTKVAIKRALISVYDKTGLTDLARALDRAGVEIVSTGSTAAAIGAAGV